MVKPRGSICNLACAYCYFLSKKQLYPGSRFHMDEVLLEDFTRQYIEAQPIPEVTFGWQGGEPTLLGVEYYKRAIEFQHKHAPAGMRVINTLQTNGTLLDDEWCEFFRANDFLVGISIDGPQGLHDRYRVDRGGKPTFDRVMAGLALLKKHRVEFNVLTTVHAGNQSHPLDVYRFLRDEVPTRFMQFIPIVQREGGSGLQPGDAVSDRAGSDRSVTADGYGRFMIGVFDEWVRRDVGRVFVQLFDVALEAWAGHEPSLCVFAEHCGEALALEHNGDLYSCDHFVEPSHLLGNISREPLGELVAGPTQRSFGQAKADTLPDQCRRCEVQFVCNGGCPKDRFISTADGQAGLNYLCGGYRRFFNHIRPAMAHMAAELRGGRPPANVMRLMQLLDAGPSGADRNQPCPCGSGTKYKRCHGGHAPPVEPAV